MIGVARVSRSRIKQRKENQQHVPVRKRLTTAQRWKRSLLFLFLFGIMAFPYATKLIRDPDPARSVVFVLIAVFSIIVFKSNLNQQ